jgi:hypothetical protein
MVPELRSLEAAARVGDLRGFLIERTQRSREARGRVVFMWWSSSGMFYLGLKRPGEASVVTFRARLVSKVLQKILKIFRHLESIDACMKH